MNTRHRLHARKRYLSLGLGELTSAAVFAVVAVVGITPRLASSTTAVLALWCALVPLLLVLVQAGAYWLLARGWVGVGPMPSQLARLYRLFLVVDPLLLLVGLVGVLVWWPDELLAALLVMGVWLFGVIEYLNYFVVRLSYPASEWFARVRERRRPRLMKDVGLAGRSTERRAVARR
ncbi:hypothetical protein ACFVTX_08095 [Agromyces sp. NPDC058136]|uniref:hypothetical protein n=1 Tax=Agromyces sp. NPDC058136 TaxID=3346354 RepID=UPI0036DBA2D2